MRIFCAFPNSMSPVGAACPSQELHGIADALGWQNVQGVGSLTKTVAHKFWNTGLQGKLPIFLYTWIGKWQRHLKVKVNKENLKKIVLYIPLLWLTSWMIQRKTLVWIMVSLGSAQDYGLQLSLFVVSLFMGVSVICSQLPSENIKSKIQEINNSYVLNGTPVWVWWNLTARWNLTLSQSVLPRTWIIPMSSIYMLYMLPVH